MKILQIMAGAPVGGAETFFVDAIRGVHELGYQQHVITRNNNPYKVEQIRERNIPLDFASFNQLIPWTTKAKVKRAIKEFKPDIVHHYMGRAGNYSVAGEHVNIGWYGGYYKPERFKHCKHHVGVTYDITKHIIEQGVPPENAHTLHVYAEFPKGTPIDRAQFDTPDDAPLLVSLSRLHVKKGLDVLLKAMLQVPNAYLWIAGSGPLDAELKAQMKELKLEDRVRFLGWRNDRENLLTTADICVFPSRYEPFGAVVVEAWGTETPLVVAKAAGPKAYVTHGENGLLVEIDDVDGLAGAINQVINDKELCAHLIKNGKEAYDKDFTQKAFMREVSALYDKVLNDR